MNSAVPGAPFTIQIGPVRMTVIFMPSLPPIVAGSDSSMS